MQRASLKKLMVELKSKREIEKMRAAGRIVAETLEKLKQQVKPGLKTQELDRLADEFIHRQGGVPAFKGYRGYPASICVSIDNEVVHGIPGERVIREGQVVSLDIGVLKAGYYADGAFSLAVGTVPEEVTRLLRIAEESLYCGLDFFRVGNRLGDVSSAIERKVEENNFSVVRDLVGHGIGRQMHEEPAVPNFGRPGTGMEIRPGLVVAIEPRVNLGGWPVETRPDGWTIVTQDGTVSAHFEHTVAATEEGPVVLTQR